MSISKGQERKKLIVDEIKEKLEKSSSLIVLDYRGLDVEETTELRNKFREAGVDYKVYRNTLVKRAIEGTDYEGLTEDLNGPNGIAFGFEDPVAPAKIAKTFSEKHDNLDLKVGVLEGEIYRGEKLEKLASIPSREELIAKLLGSLKAPLSNFVYLVKALADKKEEENN